MKWTFAAAIAAIALPSAAQTMTVAFTDEQAMSVAGYEIDAYHQERLDHWRGEIDRKTTELRDQSELLQRNGANWSPDRLKREQEKFEKLQAEMNDLNEQGLEETGWLAANARSEFRKQADPSLSAFARTNGIGEILVDPTDEDGMSFVVLNPAYDISARIGEMLKSGAGAEVAAGPDRPPVILYVRARDAYYDTGIAEAREKELIAAMLKADEDFLTGQRNLESRLADLEQRRLLLTPDQQELVEARLETDARAQHQTYEETLETNRLRREAQFAAFKTDVYIFLSNRRDLVKADIVRFIDDDALDGTFFVAHPALDITDLVTQQMTLPD